LEIPPADRVLRVRDRTNCTSVARTFDYLAARPNIDRLARYRVLPANPSGITGIDGLFRFRADGTNERGLAVLRIIASDRKSLRRHRAAWQRNIR
jgi:predicted choloylglycine hydrolase